jgi:hypothetical protein
MASFVARMMDAETGGEGRYVFQAPDDLFQRTPIQVVRAFMDHVDRDEFPHQHIEYELNAAFRSQDRKVVTAMGQLILEHLPPIPFMLMISPDG